jgi:2-oxoglutarate dehydrogenase E1 component
MYDYFLKSSGLSPDSVAYIDNLYEIYLSDPSRLERSWSDFFDSLQALGHVDQSQDAVRSLFAHLARQSRPSLAQSTVLDQSVSTQSASAQCMVSRWIEAYRNQGYRAGDYDPLGRIKPESPEEIKRAHFGLSDSDQTAYETNGVFDKPAKLLAIEAHLSAAYAHHIGCESQHIASNQERMWLFDQMEHQPVYSADEQKKLLRILAQSEGMEQYLGIHFVGQKRFSLEGAESFIVLVDSLIHRAAESGVDRVVMGMAHRGRLNTLVNVMGMSAEDLCDQFSGKKTHGDTSGDVKYHSGRHAYRRISGREIGLTLAFNPSHLEAIVPVVMGMARARQDSLTDAVDSRSVLPILVHGDAAISGQGVVMEALNMSKTPANNVQGSVHIVINNQVGFTTDLSSEARSSESCTDIAKTYGYPIFHVNGDDPEAVVTVSRMALAYRQRFGKSVFINLVTYRRHGHNEADEPAHTQPMMYAYIRKHPSTFSIYANNLIAQSVMDDASVKALQQEIKQRMGRGDCLIDDLLSSSSKRDQRKSIWHKFLHKTWKTPHKTSFSKKRFLALAKAMAASLEGVNLHRQIANLMKQRAEMTAETMPVRWGYAELMAYATLIDEGYSIRIVGEDACRGTFAHRHAVIHDTQNGHMVTPLHHLPDSKAKCSIYNASLSEFASMGFEYGYAITDPNTLVVWEAQFGDFANGAQVIIDQFLSSGWQKWQRLCGLVLFLPHGYEGMGPEHSSARLERFLQLCAEHNMQVCVPSNAAQIFHLIRRQMQRSYRKPLVVMTPKSLLRLPEAMSPMDDLTSGKFQCVIDDVSVKSKKIKRVLLCSGKSYYDLSAMRAEHQLEGVAIVRVEQLYPFPYDDLKVVLQSYAAVDTIVWCQEEPRNQGAWYMKRHCIIACLSGKQRLFYAGRSRFASPACGYPALHKKQQALWLAQALGLESLVEEDHEL